MQPDNDADDLSPDDMLRAGVYRLLAGLLSVAPGSEELAAIGDLTGDDTALGHSIATLAAVARRASPDDVAAEFVELVAPGRGEVPPFATHYVEEEAALARLRADMARLGIERDPDVDEPEDHIATLLELMAGLIDGSFGEPASLEEQRGVFDSHLGGWASAFFRDLGAAPAASFYMAVAGVGSTFLQAEDESFALV